MTSHGARSAFARMALRLTSALAACAALVVTGVRADPIPTGSVSHNFQVVGFSSLGGRYGGFKIALNRAANGRWYLYEGHSFDRGWSILDVTVPEHPRYVKFIPFHGPKAWVTAQASVDDNLLVTAIDHRGDRTPGVGAIFWDVSDPENPREIARWTGGVGGTHRNAYPGGRYAYLAGTYPGFTGRVLVILDVSDPAHPKEVGKWWQPGQKQGEPAPSETAPSESNGPLFSFHGPANISPDGKMLTTGYSPDIVNLDISDPSSPKLIGRLRMVPPFPNVGAQSVHTVLPMWDRNLLYVSVETLLPNCLDAGFDGAMLVDNSNPAAPHVISVLPTPRPPPGAPYRSFCDKGGRFGPHNTNQEIHNSAVAKPGNLLYVAWFNAGLRVFDISDPYTPSEVGYFIHPSDPG